MNRQRKVVITTTYNELGIIVDTKAEELDLSAQPDHQWTPSGKKPPEKGRYLVWMPFAPPERRITVAEYCGGYWNIKTPISAWMPLPEPYREEGEE